MRLLLGSLLLAACSAPDLLPDVGVDDPREAMAERVLAEKHLPLRNCAGNDAFGVSGVYAVRFVTRATTNGGGLINQVEQVTRYGVAQLCVSQRDIVADLLVCAMTLSPVLHPPSGTCAAEEPKGAALLAALPVARFTGAINIAGDSVNLARWGELWGIRDGALLPTPMGIEQIGDGEPIFDQDGDGHPGVTLEGSGLVPTTSYVARITEADFALTNTGGPNLSGRCGSQTAQVVLGGPATRLLRPRAYTVAEAGAALFLRADGLAGSDDIGVADDRVTCAEVAAFSELLDVPEEGACTIPEVPEEEESDAGM